MSTDRNKDIVRRHFEEIYNHGNYDFADECCTPDVLFHDPLWPETPTGPRGLREYAHWARAAAPDLRFEIEDIIAEGDRVAVRYHFSGTQHGPILGIPPTGRFAVMTGLTFYRMKEGRIAEAWVHWDVLAMLRAMGVPVPGAAQEAHA
jgi:steroid delta-isomerase-like uncharacterized protein